VASSGSILGNPVLRTEDPRILRGDADYFDDLEVDGLLHVAFVRSTIAHARIGSVDTTEAAHMPGVVAVYTAEDLGLERGQGFAMVPAALSRPPLARDVVRFVGDIVAVVVAETRAQAVDAAEVVIVDYDPLPTVIDPEAALAEDAPLVFPEHGSNLAIEFNFGDDPSIFDDADVVVEGRFLNQRLAPVPMEPNGILVELDGDDGLTLHVPTQNPHGVRDPLAGVVGLEEDRIRVVATAVGGGFGAKAGMYPEFAIVATAARKLGRPLKWSESRSENMTAMTHGRGQIQYIELGLKRDGTFTGLRGRIVCDGGAYPGIGAFLPYLTRSMSQGVYRIPRIQMNSKSAITNTTPTAAYRGAGRPEAAALLERIVDIAAMELGRDPVDLRKQNFLRPDEFPLTTVTGANYDSADYVKALGEACRVAGYEDLRHDQAERRERGDVKQLGIGLSVYTEVTAGGLFQEFGAVEVHTDGTVTATVGTSPHGQGLETAFKMIVAELLGIPMDAVNVVQSDTSLVPRGMGTMGSRSLQIGGTAIYKTSELVVDKAKRLAAHLLEADVADIVVHEGEGVGAAGAPATALSWAELAMAASDPARRPADFEEGLRAELDFNQGEATYPFGAHIAIVEVDTETGRVELLRHVAVDDCGRVINPLLVAGQQHGGIAQGVAQALYEGVQYDDDGNPQTANLMDYAMPSAAELPSFEASNTETPTPLNPLGAKGIGEAGTIGSTPAAQNAVVDALSIFGIRHLDMPLTSERVWQAIRDAATTG
jgi:carbon-monoxide dehydrogenase large subunit